MPISFCFVNKKAENTDCAVGAYEPFDTLDAKICKALETQEDKEYARGVDTVALLGIAAMMSSKSKKRSLTARALSSWLGRKEQDDLDVKTRRALRKFLIDDYEFQSWR